MTNQKELLEIDESTEEIGNGLEYRKNEENS